MKLETLSKEQIETNYMFKKIRSYFTAHQIISLMRKRHMKPSSFEVLAAYEEYIKKILLRKGFRGCEIKRDGPISIMQVEFLWG